MQTRPTNKMRRTKRVSIEKQQATKRSREEIDNEPSKKHDSNVNNSHLFVDIVIKTIFEYFPYETRVLMRLSHISSEFRRIYLQEFSNRLILMKKENDSKWESKGKLPTFIGITHLEIYLAEELIMPFDQIAKIIKENSQLKIIFIDDERGEFKQVKQAKQLLKAITSLGHLEKKPAKTTKTLEPNYTSELEELSLPSSVFKGGLFPLFKTAMKFNPNLKTIEIQAPFNVTAKQLIPLVESFSLMKSVTRLNLHNVTFFDDTKRIFLDSQSKFNFTGLESLCLFDCDAAQSLCENLLPKTLNLKVLEIEGGILNIAFANLSIRTLVNLPKLTQLSLNETMHTWTLDKLLCAFKNSKNLQYLRFAHSKLSGRGFECLENIYNEGRAFRLEAFFELQHYLKVTEWLQDPKIKVQCNWGIGFIDASWESFETCVFKNK